MSSYSVTGNPEREDFLSAIVKPLQEIMDNLYISNDIELHILEPEIDSETTLLIIDTTKKGRFSEEHLSHYRHSLYAVLHVAKNLAGVSFRVDECERIIFKNATEFAKAMDAITADPAKKILPPTNSTQPDAKADGIGGTEKTK